MTSGAVSRRDNVAVGLLAAAALLVVAYISAAAFDSQFAGARLRTWQQIYAAMEAICAIVLARAAGAPGLVPRERRGWRWFAAGFALLALSAAGIAGPSGASALIADWGWIASFPCFIFGLFSFSSAPLNPRERRRALLDSGVLLTSTLLLIWYLGTRGIRIQGPETFATFTWFNGLILTSDALLLYAVGIAAVRTPERLKRWSWRLLLGTFVLSLVGDVSFVVQAISTQAGGVPIGVAQVLWPLAAWLTGFAAMRETQLAAGAATPSEGVQVPSAALSVIPYGAAAMIGLVVFYEGSRLPDPVFRILATGVVVIATLVALRLVLALRENAELVEDQERQAAQLRESQKLEAIGRLAGGVAHEFNNLLMVIQQGTDAVLARNRSDADARDVQSAASRAAELTRQLLTFSRREAATGATNARAALASLRPLLQRLVPPDVLLDIAAGSGLRAVAIDRSSFDQVLFNLVRNAVDAIQGAGRIDVRLDASPALPGVRLTVTDSGAGMPESVRERLFEPFFSTKQVGKGTGLGLAIVHGIVSGAGGRINVETELGKGSTFIIDLPEAPPDAVEVARFGLIPTPPPDEVPRIVLLVDDEPTVRRSLRRTLERLGHTVCEAEDGIAALAVMDESTTIDVLLTDTVMPRMNGWDLIREVRRRRPNLPIIRMSGYAEPPDDAGHDVTPDAFLAKPFDLAVLRDMVRQVAAGRSAFG